MIEKFYIPSEFFAIIKLLRKHKEKVDPIYVSSLRVPNPSTALLIAASALELYNTYQGMNL